MYFYYVDVSKLKDNKTKLDLREEFEKCGWELFSVNYGFNWFIREFAVGYDGAINQIFHLCLLKFAFLRRVFIQKIDLHFYLFSVRVTVQNDPDFFLAHNPTHQCFHDFGVKLFF